MAMLVTVAAACAGARGPAPPSPEQIPALEQEAEARPEDASVLARLGAAYREAGDLQQARRVLEQAHEAAPAHGPSALFLGLTYEDLERFDRAREVYGAYLETGESPPLAEEVRDRLTLLRRQELQAAVEEAVQREDELADRDPSPRTVAVFPFLYRGPDPRYRPLGRALAEFLVTDLSRTERLRVVERMRIQLLLDEFALADSGYVDPSTAARSGRLLGAGRIVQGLLQGGDEELRVEAAVVDASQPPARLEPSITGSRSPEDIFQLQAEVALGIYRDLGIELTPAERERVTRRPTESLDALLAFGRGLIAEDSAHFGRAAEHFRRAASIDPGFDLAGERAETASSISSAQSLGSAGLASRAASRFYPARPHAAVFDPGRAVSGADVLAPLPGQRDAVVEVLGFEGLSSTTVEFRIIVTPSIGGIP